MPYAAAGDATKLYSTAQYELGLRHTTPLDKGNSQEQFVSQRYVYCGGLDVYPFQSMA
jgi:hypothetical protein